MTEDVKARIAEIVQNTENDYPYPCDAAANEIMAVLAEMDLVSRKDVFEWLNNQAADANRVAIGELQSSRATRSGLSNPSQGKFGLALDGAKFVYALPNPFVDLVSVEALPTEVFE